MAKGQKFRVEEWVHYSKLGRRRKKLIKYRKARGRDNKVRLKIKGHLRNVDIGFRGEKNKRGLINGKTPVLIYNLNDLNNLKEKEIGVVGRIGSRKRIEIANYCIKHNLKLLNLNSHAFIEKAEQKKNMRKLEREKLHKKREEKKSKKEEKKEEKNKEQTEKTTEDKETLEEKKWTWEKRND